MEPISQAQVGVENSGSALTQALGSLVLEQLALYRRAAVARMEKNREIARYFLLPLLNEELLEGDFPPYSSVYFPRLTKFRGSIGFATNLVRTHGLVLAPGRYFGSPNHVRIGLGGAPKILETGLRILGRELRKRASASHRL